MINNSPPIFIQLDLKTTIDLKSLSTLSDIIDSISSLGYGNVSITSPHRES